MSTRPSAARTSRLFARLTPGFAGALFSALASCNCSEPLIPAPPLDIVMVPDSFVQNVGATPLRIGFAGPLPETDLARFRAGLALETAGGESVAFDVAPENNPPPPRSGGWSVAVAIQPHQTSAGWYRLVFHWMPAIRNSGVLKPRSDGGYEYWYNTSHSLTPLWAERCNKAAMPVVELQLSEASALGPLTGFTLRAGAQRCSYSANFDTLPSTGPADGGVPPGMVTPGSSNGTRTDGLEFDCPVPFSAELQVTMQQSGANDLGDTLAGFNGEQSWQQTLSGNNGVVSPDGPECLRWYFTP